MTESRGTNRDEDLTCVASTRARVARYALREVGRDDLERYVAVARFGSSEPFACLWDVGRLADEDKAILDKAMAVAEGAS